jgi:hypothetical protein
MGELDNGRSGQTNKDTMNPSEIAGQLQGSLRVQDIAWELLSESDKNCLLKNRHPNPIPEEVDKRLDEALAKARAQVEAEEDDQ